MQLPSDYVAPTRLLAMFVLITGLPLVALAWLGGRVLEQDRALASQRRLERLQNSANQLADRLSAATATRDADLPSDVTWLRFDARGVIERRGIPLVYYPAVAAPPEAPAHVFARVEESEIATPVSAIEGYGALAASPNPAIRAGALMRKARVQIRAGKTEDALATYNELVALASAPVAGAPAELVGRRQRAMLFERAGDAAAARAERHAIESALSDGRYILDRATFDFYSEGLSGVVNHHPQLTATLDEWWPRWHTERIGRTTWTAGDAAFAAVWTTAASGTVAVAGYDASAGAAATDIGARRNLLVAGFALVAVVIVAAGYFVFRALQRELNVARLQSEFVAQVSHEFRTPLTAIRHLTELLEEGAPPPDRLAEFHGALGRETRRLHAMVESLLDFGRIESGRQVYQMEETCLADVAERVVSAFDSPRVQLVVAETAPRSRIDRDALSLALQNLVDNAMKYSPSSSPVTVSVDASGNRGHISVEDRGAGLSYEEQRDVRRKFVRGSAARTFNVKGTGIGLAIVDQVAKAHGGRLDVDSAPGRGSRFTISVPLSGYSS
jgi:signal transduction histidine kinase